ncbi:hypothetical protein PUN28_006949 [Cardiocondyla obscurior]|uniref:Uncharacterized protein n=1 Tax=Cardiocondyla obscurior TaxID=286306 RepID=A0AAW2G3L9_9HYME
MYPRVNRRTSNIVFRVIFTVSSLARQETGCGAAEHEMEIRRRIQRVVVADIASTSCNQNMTGARTKARQLERKPNNLRGGRGLEEAPCINGATPEYASFFLNTKLLEWKLTSRNARLPNSPSQPTATVVSTQRYPPSSKVPYPSIFNYTNRSRFVGVPGVPLNHRRKLQHPERRRRPRKGILRRRNNPRINGTESAVTADIRLYKP